MAAKAPTVNDDVEIVIVLPDRKSFHLTRQRPAIDGCPASLHELESMVKKYGPQKTDIIGHPNAKPSSSQKLGGRK